MTPDAEPLALDVETDELPPEAPIPDAELHALLLQARRTQDAPLHRLVIGYLTLRRVTADVVALVAAREGGAGVANTPLVRRARQLAVLPPR